MKRDHTKRVALYARVSTDGQTVENQLRELRAVAKRHGWEIVEEYSDRGISGTKGKEQRPAFKAVCQAVARKEVELVAAWSVDRLSRSLLDLVNFLGELHAKHVDLYLHQQGLDTGTPAGKAMFRMMGVFAEFEREMIVERVKAGLKRAKAEGKVLGRPRVSTDVEAKVIALRGKGEGMRKIARTLGIGNCTVQRIVNA
jgi:DNA invertase Pin-like site-specific DNA recombinase